MINVECRIFLLPNVKDHRAGGIDGGEAGIALVAGSGASPCWAIIFERGIKYHFTIIEARETIIITIVI